jgi:hypothetical protein
VEVETVRVEPEVNPGAEEERDLVVEGERDSVVEGDQDSQVSAGARVVLGEVGLY